jgi:hypothetical protein
MRAQAATGLFDVNYIVSIFLCSLFHALAVSHDPLSKRERKRKWRAVSFSDIGAGGGNKTPPPMHQVRRVSIALEDTTKEVKLHGLAVSSSCVFL